MKLLVADDDPVIRRFVGALLQGINLGKQRIHIARPALAFEQPRGAVRFPALGFVGCEGLRKITGTVAKQQLFQSVVVKTGAAVRQFGGG